MKMNDSPALVSLHEHDRTPSQYPIPLNVKSSHRSIAEDLNH
jgi:hypothetical protein